MERLDKLVADYARMTRKEARAAIRSGSVRVNGSPIRQPDSKVDAGDAVEVGGSRLAALGPVYIMLNKPSGVLCATRDRSCATVLDLLSPALARKGLFPAGRLDKDTEGFVLITDDGAFAHRILSPKAHVPKTYLAMLDKSTPEAPLREAFAAGLELDGGDRTSPARLRFVEGGDHPLAEVIIYEGMYHQVKRMFAGFGLEVIRLRRVAMGGLELDRTLAPGEARAITVGERHLLEQGEPPCMTYSHFHQ